MGGIEEYPNRGVGEASWPGRIAPTAVGSVTYRLWGDLRVRSRKKPNSLA